MRRMIHLNRILGLGTACWVMLVCAPWTHAAPGGLPAPASHADSSPEWESLREKLFRSRAIDATPDITLAELRERLITERGETFALSTIHDFYRRHRITFKKRPRTPASKRART